MPDKKRRKVEEDIYMDMGTPKSSGNHPKFSSYENIYVEIKSQAINRKKSQDISDDELANNVPQFRDRQRPSETGKAESPVVDLTCNCESPCEGPCANGLVSKKISLYESLLTDYQKEIQSGKMEESPIEPPPRKKKSMKRESANESSTIKHTEVEKISLSENKELVKHSSLSALDAIAADSSIEIDDESKSRFKLEGFRSLFTSTPVNEETKPFPRRNSSLPDLQIVGDDISITKSMGSCDGHPLHTQIPCCEKNSDQEESEVDSNDHAAKEEDESAPKRPSRKISGILFTPSKKSSEKHCKSHHAKFCFPAISDVKRQNELIKTSSSIRASVNILDWSKRYKGVPQKMTKADSVAALTAHEHANPSNLNVRRRLDKTKRMQALRKRINNAFGLQKSDSSCWPKVFKRKKKIKRMNSGKFMKRSTKTISQSTESFATIFSANEKRLSSTLPENWRHDVISEDLFTTDAQDSVEFPQHVSMTEGKSKGKRRTLRERLLSPKRLLSKESTTSLDSVAIKKAINFLDSSLHPSGSSNLSNSNSNEKVQSLNRQESEESVAASNETLDSITSAKSAGFVQRAMSQDSSADHHDFFQKISIKTKLFLRTASIPDMTPRILNAFSKNSSSSSTDDQNSHEGLDGASKPGKFSNRLKRDTMWNLGSLFSTEPIKEKDEDQDLGESNSSQSDTCTAEVHGITDTKPISEDIKTEDQIGLKNAVQEDESDFEPPEICNERKPSIVVTDENSHDHLLTMEKINALCNSEDETQLPFLAGNINSASIEENSGNGLTNDENMTAENNLLSPQNILTRDENFMHTEDSYPYSCDDFDVVRGSLNKSDKENLTDHVESENNSMLNAVPNSMERDQNYDNSEELDGCERSTVTHQSLTENRSSDSSYQTKDNRDKLIYGDEYPNKSEVPPSPISLTNETKGPKPFAISISPLVTENTESESKQDVIVNHVLKTERCVDTGRTVITYNAPVNGEHVKIDLHEIDPTVIPLEKCADTGRTVISCQGALNRLNSQESVEGNEASAGNIRSDPSAKSKGALDNILEQCLQSAADTPSPEPSSEFNPFFESMENSSCNDCESPSCGIPIVCIDTDFHNEDAIVSEELHQEITSWKRNMGNEGYFKTNTRSNLLPPDDRRRIRANSIPESDFEIEEESNDGDSNNIRKAIKDGLQNKIKIRNSENSDEKENGQISSTKKAVPHVSSSDNMLNISINDDFFEFFRDRAQEEHYAYILDSDSENEEECAKAVVEYLANARRSSIDTLLSQKTDDSSYLQPQKRSVETGSLAFSDYSSRRSSKVEHEPVEPIKDDVFDFFDGRGTTESDNEFIPDCTTGQPKYPSDGEHSLQSGSEGTLSKDANDTVGKTNSRSNLEITKPLLSSDDVIDKYAKVTSSDGVSSNSSTGDDSKGVKYSSLTDKEIVNVDDPIVVGGAKKSNETENGEDSKKIENSSLTEKKNENVLDSVVDGGYKKSDVTEKGTDSKCVENSSLTEKENENVHDFVVVGGDKMNDATVNCEESEKVENSSLTEKENKNEYDSVVVGGDKLNDATENGNDSKEVEKSSLTDKETINVRDSGPAVGDKKNDATEISDHGEMSVNEDCSGNDLAVKITLNENRVNDDKRGDSVSERMSDDCRGGHGINIDEQKSFDVEKSCDKLQSLERKTNGSDIAELDIEINENEERNNTNEKQKCFEVSSETVMDRGNKNQIEPSIVDNKREIVRKEYSVEYHKSNIAMKENEERTTNVSFVAAPSKPPRLFTVRLIPEHAWRSQSSKELRRKYPNSLQPEPRDLQVAKSFDNIHTKIDSVSNPFPESEVLRKVHSAERLPHSKQTNEEIRLASALNSDLNSPPVGNSNETSDIISTSKLVSRNNSMRLDETDDFFDYFKDNLDTADDDIEIVTEETQPPEMKLASKTYDDHPDKKGYTSSQCSNSVSNSGNEIIIITDDSISESKPCLDHSSSNYKCVDGSDLTSEASMNVVVDLEVNEKDSVPSTDVKESTSINKRTETSLNNEIQDQGRDSLDSSNYSATSFSAETSMNDNQDNSVNQLQLKIEVAGVPHEVPAIQEIQSDSIIQSVQRVDGSSIGNVVKKSEDGLTEVLIANVRSDEPFGNSEKEIPDGLPSDKILDLPEVDETRKASFVQANDDFYDYFDNPNRTSDVQSDEHLRPQAVLRSDSIETSDVTGFSILRPGMNRWEGMHYNSDVPMIEIKLSLQDQSETNSKQTLLQQIEQQPAPYLEIGSETHAKEIIEITSTSENPSNISGTTSEEFKFSPKVSNESKKIASDFENQEHVETRTVSNEGQHLNGELSEDHVIDNSDDLISTSLLPGPPEVNQNRRASFMEDEENDDFFDYFRGNAEKLQEVQKSSGNLDNESSNSISTELNKVESDSEKQELVEKGTSSEVEGQTLRDEKSDDHVRVNSGDLNCTLLLSGGPEVNQNRRPSFMEAEENDDFFDFYDGNAENLREIEISSGKNLDNENSESVSKELKKIDSDTEKQHLTETRTVSEVEEQTLNDDLSEDRVGVNSVDRRCTALLPGAPEVNQNRRPSFMEDEKNDDFYDYFKGNAEKLPEDQNSSGDIDNESLGSVNTPNNDSRLEIHRNVTNPSCADNSTKMNENFGGSFVEDNDDFSDYFNDKSENKPQNHEHLETSVNQSDSFDSEIDKDGIGDTNDGTENSVIRCSKNSSSDLDVIVSPISSQSNNVSLGESKLLNDTEDEVLTSSLVDDKEGRADNNSLTDHTKQTTDCQPMSPGNNVPIEVIVSDESRSSESKDSHHIESIIKKDHSSDGAGPRRRSVTFNLPLLELPPEPAEIPESSIMVSYSSNEDPFEYFTSCEPISTVLKDDPFNYFTTSDPVPASVDIVNDSQLSELQNSEETCDLSPTHNSGDSQQHEPQIHNPHRRESHTIDLLTIVEANPDLLAIEEASYETIEKSNSNLMDASEQLSTIDEPQKISTENVSIESDKAVNDLSSLVPSKANVKELKPSMDPLDSTITDKSSEIKNGDADSPQKPVILELVPKETSEIANDQEEVETTSNTELTKPTISEFLIELPVAKVFEIIDVAEKTGSTTSLNKVALEFVSNSPQYRTKFQHPDKKAVSVSHETLLDSVDGSSNRLTPFLPTYCHARKSLFPNLSTSNLSTLEKMDDNYSPRSLALGKPTIILQTWFDRQNLGDAFMKPARSSSDLVEMFSRLSVPQNTPSVARSESLPPRRRPDTPSPGTPVDQFKEDSVEQSPQPRQEERVQKDRSLDVYPETLRQRQRHRNMAPSPSKVDIKNWNQNGTPIREPESPASGKKFLPSVKALRSQFETGKNLNSSSNNGSVSPTSTFSMSSASSNASTGSTQGCGSAPTSVGVSALRVADPTSNLARKLSGSSLASSSLEKSSSNTSLNSAPSTENLLDGDSHDPDEPVEPIFCQFQKVDEELRELMSRPTSTSGWDPRTLMKRLYYVPDVPRVHSKGHSYINIEGYLEKLPSGRKKATFWNAWKKRYFVAKDGVLYYYQNSQCDKQSLRLTLMGGKVETMEGNMVGVDDGKGHYVVVRCSSRSEAERWRRALESHLVEDFASQYVQPHPMPTNPSLLRDTLIIDIGSCSVRAGVLSSQATLPQLFFPSVVATDRESRRQVWGQDALAPDTRTSASISFPMKPSHRISKYSVDLTALSSLLSKTFCDLKVDPKNYNLQISVPRVLNQHTQSELLRTLFDKFGVKGVNVTHQSILALYAYNATSGIVVDIGERMDIVPVTDGYIVEGGVSRVPYGGCRILDHLRQFLYMRNVSLVNDVESYIIRHVLESACYCAQHYNTEKAKCTNHPENFEKTVSLKEFFPNTAQCPYDAVELDFGRFQATEGLFNPDAWGLDHPGLHKLVHKAIQECSMDIRKEMSRSIFLAGGVTQLPGLADRLTTELDNLTPPAIRPKVHVSPYRYHAAYIGACTLAESPAFSQTLITRENWAKNGNAALRKWSL